VISITRSLARQLRTVMRKSSTFRGAHATLEFHAADGELRIRTQIGEVAVEYFESAPNHQETLLLPSEALDDMQGRKGSLVTLESVGDNTVQVCWNEGSIPQIKRYTVANPPNPSSFPERPATLQPMEADFLKALEDAVKTIGTNIRFATHKIQLRGGKGSVVSTDGKQVLIQSGFTFPFTEDILIPGLELFGCRELPQEGRILLGKGDKHLTLQIDGWHFHLEIDRVSRFPNVETVLPAANSRMTTWKLSTQDVDFLAGNLSRLPGQESSELSVTVDLNGQVALRAKSENQPQPTEIVLEGSEITGPAVRLSTNREYLGRAISLGFSEFHVVSAQVPIVCRDPKRIYGWMPLPITGVLAPSDNAIRITSNTAATIPKPIRERMNSPMPISNSNGRSHPNGNGQTHGHAAANNNGHTNGIVEHTDKSTTPDSNGVGSLIAEAHALRDYLHDGYARASRLCVAIKRQRKQSRLVQSTLASLRQLQTIES